jgi:hypothetical protein
MISDRSGQDIRRAAEIPLRGSPYRGIRDMSRTRRNRYDLASCPGRAPDTLSSSRSFLVSVYPILLELGRLGRIDKPYILLVRVHKVCMCSEHTSESDTTKRP